MGYNTSKFDKDAHYASKTTKELEKLVVFWEKAISEYDVVRFKGPPNQWINELHIVKMKLAERIGKKK
jgi:hypothetical protein